MNLRLPLLILFICALGGEVWSAEKLCAIQTGVFPFLKTSSAVDLAFDDLDVRDSNNQPIQTVTAKQELKDLFQSSLYTALVQSELYTMAAVFSIFEKALNMAATALVKDIAATVGGMIAALLPSTKEWKHILVCVSSLLGFSLLLFSCSLLPESYPLSFIRIAPLNLLC